jgi:hypothetical protein
MRQRTSPSKCIVPLLALLLSPACGSSSVGGGLDASPVTRDATADSDNAGKDTVAPDTGPRDLLSPLTGRPCYSDDPDSCVCDSFSGPQVTDCSVTSVIHAADEVSGCCQDSSSILASCECVAYVCRNDSATHLCTCDRVGNTQDPFVTGTRVAACPAPASGQICCMTTGWPRACICSSMAACGAGQTQVSGCSSADLAAICPKGETSVTLCL